MTGHSSFFCFSPTSLLSPFFLWRNRLAEENNCLLLGDWTCSRTNASASSKCHWNPLKSHAHFTVHATVSEFNRKNNSISCHTYHWVNCPSQLEVSLGMSFQGSGLTEKGTLQEEVHTCKPRYERRHESVSVVLAPSPLASITNPSSNVPDLRVFSSAMLLSMNLLVWLWLQCPSFPFLLDKFQLTLKTQNPGRRVMLSPASSGRLNCFLLQGSTVPSPCLQEHTLAHCSNDLFTDCPLLLNGEPLEARGRVFTSPVSSQCPKYVGLIIIAGIYWAPRFQTFFDANKFSISQLNRCII